MIQNIRKDKKGVSPVIGVILMVAATIVIAAVVITMLGGFTAPEITPTMNFKLVDNDGAGANTVIKLTHFGGDSALASDMQYQIVDSADNIDVVWAVMPNPGDTIWDTGDFATLTDPGAADLYTVSVRHVPTGQLIYEGTVRVV